ncbi:MAG TPA: lycopene cyclase family protein [Actinomycetes bacterium]|nr:lycopene cyclase family protein [Actinomycetes bacterium]
MAADSASVRWDAVIAGGGLSGLSLACHLATSAWRDRSVLIVDDGSKPLDGRAWAFWSTDPGLLGGAVDRSFDRLRICAHGAAVDVRLENYRYRVVSGESLRRVTAALLATAPRFRLERGHVDATEEHPHGAVVRVDGRPVMARWVFDSVTAAPDSQARAWLAFTGWDVRTTEDRFDPAVATLMDFRTPQDGEARFVYVLPSAARRALVEHTRFGSGRPFDGEAALRSYLDDVVRAGPYDVIRREGGRLPLRSVSRPSHTGHVLPIGIRGGQLKASTGYAFTRIQRDSAAIARSLTECRHPFALPIPRRRHAFLDALLLDVLAAEPERLERAFLHLFARNPADRVLRFLDEDSSLVDEARLVATLPPAPFVRAMLRRAQSRTTRARRFSSA